MPDISPSKILKLSESTKLLFSLRLSRIKGDGNSHDACIAVIADRHVIIIVYELLLLFLLPILSALP